MVTLDLQNCHCKWDVTVTGATVTEYICNVCCYDVRTVGFLNFRDGAEDEAAAQDLARRWKSEADTVVIGGGIAGCSVAYHLAKQVGFLTFFACERAHSAQVNVSRSRGIGSDFSPGTFSERVGICVILFSLARA